MEVKKYDMYFLYKTILRNVLLTRNIYVTNSFNIPFFKSLIIFFDVIDITDIDDIRALNYGYFARFYFGRKVVLTQMRSTFHLGVSYYSYRALITFSTRECFFPLGVFVNDILGRSSSHICQCIVILFMVILFFFHLMISCFFRKKK